MGTYINQRVIKSFMWQAKGLKPNGIACGVSHIKQKIKLRHYNMDVEHRALRIMAKHGYMNTQERSDNILYTMAPKGIALYDSMIIFSEQL